MLAFWIIFGVLDFLILLFFFLLCYTSMRRRVKPLDEQSAIFGSARQLITGALQEGKAFYDTHPAELLVLEANGEQLSARYFRQKEPRGRILLFHGYRSSASGDFAAAVSFYYEQGYELVLPDQRAHGKSTGLWIGFGALERFDCLAWVRYMNAEYGALPTFLSGISMGASTVLMALGLPLPENVKGVIADCGFTSPAEIVAHVLKRRTHLPAFPLVPILSLFARIFTGASFSCSTVDALKENHIPVLFIHGESDHFVPHGMTLRSYEACAAEKRLISVPGAGHGTSYLVDRPRVQREVSAFLKACMK